MTKQFISDEKFTNVQKAQAGLTRLFEEAQKSSSFYRVLKNDQPLGVLIPNEVWEDFLEDMEALSSSSYKESVLQARKDKKRYSMKEVKKQLGI